MGSLHYFLGISVHRSTHGMFLRASIWKRFLIVRICEIAIRAQLQLRPPPNFPLLRDLLSWTPPYFAALPVPFSTSHLVDRISLMWSSGSGLFIHDLRAPHLATMKRVLRYIKGSLDHRLTLLASSSLTLTAYSDADWGGCPDSGRSTCGYCVFLGSSLVSLSSKRQASTSRSSAEAEYHRVANAVAETIWLRQLLLYLHCPI